MTVQIFHKDKYALVIDLRSDQANLTAHDGKVVDTQSEISGPHQGDQACHHNKRRM